MSDESFSALIRKTRDEASGRPAGEILDEVAAAIRTGSTFVVTSHVNPDGDALGSELALLLALRRIGKSVTAVNATRAPARLEALFPAEVVDAAVGGPTVPDRPEWYIVLDTSEPSRLAEVESLVYAAGQKRICLDHHPFCHGAAYDHLLVVPQAPATSVLVMGLIESLSVPLDSELALPLWVGLSTDTGWFRFANTNPLAMAAAAKLLECGLDPESLYRRIYGSQSLARARVLGEVLRGVKAELNGRLVWSSVRRSLLDDTGLAPAELDGVVDHLKTVEGAEIVALVVEIVPGRFKVSLRSPGAANVMSLARSFGGGGHPKAAGYRRDGPLAELIAALCARAEDALGGREATPAD